MAKKSKKKVSKKSGQKKASKKASKKKRPVSTDWMDDQQEELDNKRLSSRADFHKLDAGDTILRAVTFENEGGRKQLLQPQNQHWYDGEDGRKTAICSGKDDCPVCDLEGDVNSKIWEKIKPSGRVLMNAILRERKGDKHVIVQLPPSVADNIWGKLKDASKMGRDMTDLQEGIDFKINKSGSGMQTRYKVELDDEEPIDLEVTPADLSAMVKPPEKSELKELAKKLRKLT